jgi:hypothetical protein
LEALLDAASESGIAECWRISDSDKAELAKANVYYKDKGFEYFQVRFAMRDEPPLPSLDALKKMAESLLKSIYQLAMDAS